MFESFMKELLGIAIQGTLDYVFSDSKQSTPDNVPGKSVYKGKTGVWRQVNTEYNPQTHRHEGGHPHFFPDK